MPRGEKFQFPSNGKAYPKNARIADINDQKSTRFNSLQTGKRIQSSQHKKYYGEHIGFQFPSNGKAYPKAKKSPPLTAEAILFQFPSNGKAYPKRVSSEGV